MVIDAIKMALEEMDKEYCMLSQIDYWGAPLLVYN